jgi:hypothetical protein
MQARSVAICGLESGTEHHFLVHFQQGFDWCPDFG